MVARLIEGFEQSTVVADYAGRWTTFPDSTAAVISTTYGRTGNGLGVTGSSGVFIRTLDAQATWVVGFAFRSAAALGAVQNVVRFLDGAVIHCGLALNPDGTLFAWRGTNATSIGTCTGVLSYGAWTYLEVKATIHDTAGVFSVRVNGASVLNLTTADTRNAGNATANQVSFAPTTSLGTTRWSFDDLYVFDGTGSPPTTDFAGDCKVETLLPSGAGATTAWTPSVGGAGSNYACVDEATLNSDTDYVSSSTATQTDTYATGNLTTTAGTVLTVQATAAARKDDAGSRSVALVARPGSTDRVGATQALGAGYQYYQQALGHQPGHGRGVVDRRGQRDRGRRPDSSRRDRSGNGGARAGWASGWSAPPPPRGRPQAPPSRSATTAGAGPTACWSSPSPPARPAPPSPR